jgi:hypothetical protein
VHAPNEDKDDVIKDSFYEELEQMFYQFQIWWDSMGFNYFVATLNSFPQIISVTKR